MLSGGLAINKTEKMDLSAEEIQFYSRQIILSDIGYKGQLKLKKAKVCVVGLGGLGSVAASQLAAMGVGHLRLVDYDIVELSNLQRQLLYGVNHLGYAKVEAANKRLLEINPNIIIDPLPLSLNIENAEEIIRDMDIVVDGLDTMTPRYILNRTCQKLEIPYIFGAAIMTFGNTTTIIPKQTPCLECFQVNLDDDLLPKCATVGVHPSILNIIASTQVSEVVKIIIGEKPSLANKILYCDMGNLDFEKIEIAKAENCPVCGTTPSNIPKPIKKTLVKELCGRKGKRVFVITPKKNLKLNMTNLISSLANKFRIRVKGNLGTTFYHNSDNSVSILKSGIMIIEGVNSEKEAYNFYKKIISEKK
jgi:adenylyltransferase/sulfurtransferase